MTVIIETAHEADGGLIINRTQNVEAILRQAAEERANPIAQSAAGFRKVGTVPLVVAENWAKECGAAIGTAEFLAHCKQKMMSGEFSKLRVWEGSY